MVPNPDEIAQFIEYLRGKDKKTGAVCGCDTFDEYMSVFVKLWSVPMFKSTSAENVGATHDCVTIYFDCNGCGATNIPLTIESGPNHNYYERWGEYNKHSAIFLAYNLKFPYVKFKCTIEEKLNIAGYNLLLNNCKNFAYYVFAIAEETTLIHNNYFEAHHIFVSFLDNLSSFKLFWIFAKYVFLLPYRHFIYWNYYEKHPCFLVVEHEDAPTLETFNQFISKKMDEKTELAVTIQGYDETLHKYVSMGPIYLDNAKIEPSICLWYMLHVQEVLVQKRMTREKNGQSYSDTKTRSFKIIDFLLSLFMMFAFKIYTELVVLLSYKVSRGMKLNSAHHPLFFRVWQILKDIFFHYWDKNKQMEVLDDMGLRLEFYHFHEIGSQ